MRCRPVVDRLHEPFGIEPRPEPEQVVAGGGSPGACVVPQGGVERFWRKSVCGFETLVEALRPDTPLCPVECRFVAECFGNDLSERLREPVVITLVGILHEELYGIRVEVVHIRVAVLYAHEAEQFPCPLGRCPAYAPAGNASGQGAYLPREAVHRHERHQASIARQFYVALRACRQRVFEFVEPFYRRLRMTLHEARRAVAVDGAHAAAREPVLVVERQDEPRLAGFADDLPVKCEILVREVFRCEMPAEREDGASAVPVALREGAELFRGLRPFDRGVVPEPERHGAVRCGRVAEFVGILCRTPGCGQYAGQGHQFFSHLNSGLSV